MSGTSAAIGAAFADNAPQRPPDRAARTGLLDARGLRFRIDGTFREPGQFFIGLGLFIQRLLE